MEPKPSNPLNKVLLVGVILLSAFGFLNELYMGSPPNVLLLVGLFTIFITSTFFLLRSEGMF